MYTDLRSSINSKYKTTKKTTIKQIIKLLRTNEKEKNLKSSLRTKKHIMYAGTKTKMTSEFSPKIIQVKDHFKVLKENKLSS